MSTNLGDLIKLDRDPSKVAIICNNQTVTYSQLHNMSNYAANFFVSNGINKGDKVALIHTNSVEYLAHFFGILKVGAIAVLINIKLPEIQKDYILEDSHASMVLHDFPVIDKNVTSTFESHQPNDTDPAFILYTSGSTSTPKGVIIGHRHKWIIEQKAKHPNAPKRIAIVAAPFYHMNGLSNAETLISGHGTMVLMPKFEPTGFVKAIEQHKVNSVTGVPTMLSMIIEDKNIINNVDMSSVKHIGLASAPFSKNLFESLKKLFPNAMIQNSYGLTEVNPGLFGPHKTLPTPDLSVGYPINGISYRIVDGILQIKSPSMMLGYTNTESRNITEDGYFITNDLFKIDENGFYFFLGRADDMFTNGGNNVFPRQIESVLEEHPNVMSSAVIGLEDEIKGVKPFAFVVLSIDTDEEILKQHVLKFLPPYCCPKKIWKIDTMPLTGVNKINKKLLKEQAQNDL